jgi:hypothetical protein
MRVNPTNMSLLTLYLVFDITMVDLTPMASLTPFPTSLLLFKV